MVEMAFVFVLLVMLLVGTVTSAIAFSQNNSIENAAREASRYAATLPDPATATWFEDVIGVAREGAQGNLDGGVDGQYICVAFYNGSWSRETETSGSPSGIQGGDCYTDGLPSDQSRVQVVTRRDTEIQVVVFSPDVTLEAQAAARYER